MPYRTYCFDGDKPASSAKCKDRLTLLIITNMDEPEAATVQPMSDQDIVNIVLTENDAQDESDDESEEEIPSASAIKTSVEFLEMIDQQKAFLK